MQNNHNDYEFRRREPLYPDLNVQEILDRDQARRHRNILLWAVLVFYLLTLIPTIALFYLAGFSIISLADNVLISLSGVLVGEVGVGAILLHIVKSIFTEP